MGEPAYSARIGNSAAVSAAGSSFAFRLLTLLRLRSRLRPSSSELTAATYGMPTLFSIKWLERMRSTLVRVGVGVRVRVRVRVTVRVRVRVRLG